VFVSRTKDTRRDTIPAITYFCIRTLTHGAITNSCWFRASDCYPCHYFFPLFTWSFESRIVPPRLHAIFRSLYVYTLQIRVLSSGSSDIYTPTVRLFEVSELF